MRTQEKIEHREVIEKLRLVLDAGALILPAERGLRIPPAVAQKFPTEVHFLFQHQSEQKAVLSQPREAIQKLFPFYVFRIAFTWHLRQDARSQNLVKPLLYQNPEIGASVAKSALAYLKGNRKLEFERDEEWRERGRSIVKILENGIDGLTAASHVFRELLHDLRRTNECQLLASALREKLDVLQSGRLYDPRRLGRQRAWILVSIEALLEHGAGIKTTAAELMAILDSARMACGLELEPDMQLETFRRNLLNFKKNNDLLVRLIHLRCMESAVPSVA